MLTLASDATGTPIVACLADDDRVLAAWTGSGRAQGLLVGIREVLDAAGARLPSVKRIAVATGPGSFTGTRIGLATVQGLSRGLILRGWQGSLAAMGALDVRAWSRAVGESQPEGQHAIAADAGRGEWFVQEFQFAGGEVGASCMPIGSVATSPAGSGNLEAPTPEGLAMAAMHAVVVDGPGDLLAIYVRAPDATPPRLRGAAP